jgi:2-(1,2-epoxy-1,2-dihydrophenyl)acetyl-CoA isomerase
MSSAATNEPTNEPTSEATSEATSDDDVRVARHDAVATVTLHRPERLNALSRPMVDRLRGALEALAADPTVRVVVLTGAGRGFCAGGDVGALAGDGAPTGGGGAAAADGLAATVRSCTRIVEIMRAMPQPVIAAVNGPAAGAGMALACAADLRLASTTAIFTTAFVGVGQTGDYGLAWTLPRLVGAGRARELFLTARRVDAAEAAALGLVEEVCASERLADRAAALAADLAARAPLTVAGIKASLDDAERSDLGTFLDREAERYEANARTADATEAARAYVEKRPPVFRGR